MRLTHFLLFLANLKFCWNDNSINVRLNAKWRSSSILAEISEYIGKENPEAFWNFVNSVNQEIDETSNKNDSIRNKYDFGMSVANNILGPFEMKLLRFSLATRSISPRVQAHEQIGMEFKPEKCSFSFFVYGGQAGCQLSELNLNNYDDNNLKIFSFDHIYPVQSTAEKTILIYGELGTYELKNLLLEAQSLIEKHKNLRFVVRHFSRFSDQKPSLSGYGVELALKNTEYKAVDSSSTNKLDEPENLHGLNFKILKNRHLELQNELESLRENLEKQGEIVPLKQWQLKDLGFKTCQKLKSLTEIREMEILLQDFPTHARVTSHQNLNETLQRSIQKGQETLEAKGIESGTNILAINGRVIAKGDSFVDLFALMEKVEEEKKMVNEFVKGFGNSETEEFERINIPKMLTLVDLSSVKLSEHAFDYSIAEPVYLNDLESTRSPYKSLMLMLQPFPPGQIRPISRNIFNLIMFLDPFDSDDRVFDDVIRNFQTGIHIRFGFVPILDEAKYGKSIEEAVDSMIVPPTKKVFWKSKDSLINALKKGSRFVAEAGLTQLPLVLLNGYPLDVTSIERFESSLTQNIQKQTTRLQLALLHGLIEDSVQIDRWWFEKKTNPDIIQRLNQRITTAFNNKEFLNISRRSIQFLKNVHYFSEESDTVLANADVTTWIIADFENPSNRLFATKAIRSIASQKNNKIALIPNPSSSRSNDNPCSFNFENVGPNSDMTILSKIESFCMKNINLSPLDIGVNPGETVVVSNGLLIGPLAGRTELLKTDDFNYLDTFWKEKGATKAATFFNENTVYDVTISFYCSIAKKFKEDQQRMDFDEFMESGNGNTIIFPPIDSTNSTITVTWIANPVSREAQQIISVVKILQRITNSRIEIIFNPSADIQEMPIKRFYRFVANEKLLFNEDGSMENHSVVFSNLPQKQLLTMSLETNDAWMIEVKKAEYDLDNILLETASEDVEAVYSLEHILVEGTSRKMSGEASDGLEVELSSGGKNYDTIVMLNLGYFQLKAEPGVWNLHLRNGHSADEHKIVTIDSIPVENDIQIVVDSFSGKWVELSVEELTEPKESDDELSIESLLNSAKNYFASPEPSEVINVFSLASGHLYERFMRIMMTSVLNNTKTQKVKFWLLKNYLSPKFKETIPKLAEFYKFEFELVEYKWPKWLHKQTEKQRVMWGYKILFLDVLFPLNVDKIIFVDADQVVRADLQELMDFNLNGAPYGYVPFCESRTEMDGFRFWKSGYWKNHLMGRKYHISALYVVDLKAFREFSAGDRLRGRYDSLSADPNSLSNLDQDLPNNMLHEVPIKSLPQEWLWCETWCDDGSKEKAKTIDLCNNPLTKEPKLNSAKRIIKEWTEYDSEISKVLNSADINTPSPSVDRDEL
ncbi:UDP-glucose:Glycoprotein Glucosyltransferase [Caenorhabditis elegans]|uniref:UDP-glucose:Glycoprotein Glucosyltransferase n=1 Tax=Caenorhabditis elegans TaxID=6239 RepID=G5EF14_CAEEL|nr:UDP-glucose:Glycoprotein Glucosyltransferase [Caenorhabditis elegans]CAB04207.2 UDP-glucose:Glycoprotein Glucosyltransferase [Caenorhabditis elegans]|eukprot:NP_492484.2 UDP-Glucose Glycoprotein glucosylTransferase [Caenorhabditis elegans]